MASKADIIVAVQVQLGSSSNALTPEGYEAAVSTAESELGWVLPQSDSTRILWLVKRAVRHACYILWVASAQKFKYKQVNLNQRFDHYEKLVKSMDSEYENALQSNISVFSNVESYKMFGTAVGAGFTYDSIGNDTTYENLKDFVLIGE